MPRRPLLGDLSDGLDKQRSQFKNVYSCGPAIYKVQKPIYRKIGARATSWHRKLVARLSNNLMFRYSIAFE
jgi:hypothetical protein